MNAPYPSLSIAQSSYTSTPAVSPCSLKREGRRVTIIISVARVQKAHVRYDVVLCGCILCTSGTVERERGT